MDVNIRATGGSGDQGVDLLAERDGVSYAIQCKYYSSPVGNSAVQQAHAGCGYYGVAAAAVVTNSTFTRSAMQLASSLGVTFMNDSFLIDL